MAAWCLAACWVKLQIVLIKLVEMLHFINKIYIKQYILLLNDLSNLLLYLLLKSFQFVKDSGLSTVITIKNN